MFILASWLFALSERGKIFILVGRKVKMEEDAHNNCGQKKMYRLKKEKKDTQKKKKKIIRLIINHSNN